jgi:hypothetical protein
MKTLRVKNIGLVICFAFCLINFSFTGCRVYRFSEAGQVPPHVKTIKITPIENVAQYVNPQLTPNLTERIRQKINNQTKLSLTNNDNANWVISGQITDYTVSTSGVTSTNGRSQASINRLSVTVRITLTDQVENKDPRDITVTRQFDFPASQSLQQAESRLLDEMLRNLTDEIFNQIFSNW